jgi:hypothetical protein
MELLKATRESKAYMAYVYYKVNFENHKDSNKFASEVAIKYDTTVVDMLKQRKNFNINEAKSKRNDV